MNILITSCGRRAYLIEYFKEALKVCGGGEVHALNADPITPCSLAADKFAVSPLIYDDNYIDFLLKYCRDNLISAVISVFDIDLPVLAANKELFARNGVTVIVSSPRVIEICNDKLLTCRFLSENGICAPPTFESAEEAKAALISGEANYPFVIKPRRGMGSLSMYTAENESELDILFEKVRREISGSYLKYEAALTAGKAVLAQQKIRGVEYGLDVINDLDGNYIATLAKRKLAMRAGETDSAVTVDIPELSELGRRISESLRHIGNLDVDVIIDEYTGRAEVIEMNARFGGGYPFSHNAGANLPLAIIKWLRGEHANKELFTVVPDIKAQKDIRIIRL